MSSPLISFFSQLPFSSPPGYQENKWRFLGGFWKSSGCSGWMMSSSGQGATPARLCPSDCESDSVSRPSLFSSIKWWNESHLQSSQTSLSNLFCMPCLQLYRTIYRASNEKVLNEKQACQACLCTCNRKVWCQKERLKGSGSSEVQTVTDHCGVWTKLAAVSLA